MVQVRLLAKLFFLCCIFFSFFFSFLVFVINHIFPLGWFPFILTAGPLQPREVFAINVFPGSFRYHGACIAYRDMKHLESPESIQIKSQNDRPSPEIPHESRANSRGTHEFVTFKGGAVCSKNSTFGYFDGTVWTPSLGSAPTPIIAPDIDRETFEKPQTAVCG